MKDGLRKAVRKLLKESFPPGKSRLDQRLLDNLWTLVDSRNVKAVAAYAAFREEPVLTPLMQKWLDQGRKLYLPRYRNDSDSYCMVAVSDLKRDCVCGKYGIAEPAPELPEEKQLMDGTLWLIPGLAFDNKGNRLGRGRGFYDRLLQNHPGGTRIGVCWECQILPEIPAMPWDLPMDSIVTEGGVYMT